MRQQRQAFYLCLGKQHVIKGIPVKPGKADDFTRMSRRDGNKGAAESKRQRLYIAHS